MEGVDVQLQKLIIDVDYLLLAGTTNYQGRIIYVSKNGNNATAIIGRIDRPYLTIQAAITASVAGDMIVVFAGTYIENLNWGGKASIYFVLHNAIIIGNHAATATVSSIVIDMFADSELRTNASSPIISMSNGSIKINNGKVVNNHNTDALSFNNVAIVLNNINFINTQNGKSVNYNTVQSTFTNNCRFRNTAANGTSFTINNSAPTFNNCSFVHTSTGAAITPDIAGKATFNNCYIRSQGGNAISGSLSWSIILNSCTVVANNGYALFANSNGSANIVAHNTFFYGVNTVYRGLNSPARSSKIEFYGCILYATTGEILVNNPTGATTKCLLRNCELNKVLTALQIADVTVVQNPVNIDTTITLPSLTLSN